MIWDDLGFRTEYAVDPEPDYPGDGVWTSRQVSIAGTNSVLARGAVALVTPDDSNPWLLDAEIPQVGGLYGTPHPSALLYFDRFTRAVIIDVRDPDAQTELEFRPVSVAMARDEQLLLIGGADRVLAWGVNGIAWVSEAVMDADLHIRRTDNGRIVCRGTRLGDSIPSTAEVTLDASTGRILP